MLSTNKKYCENKFIHFNIPFQQKEALSLITTQSTLYQRAHKQFKRNTMNELWTRITIPDYQDKLSKNVAYYNLYKPTNENKQTLKLINDFQITSEQCDNLRAYWLAFLVFYTSLNHGKAPLGHRYPQFISR